MSEASVRRLFRALHLALDVAEFAWDTYRWKKLEVEAEDQEVAAHRAYDPVSFDVTI